MANNKPVTVLLVIFTIVWALVLGGTIIVFKEIVPLHIFHGLLAGFVKAVLATILVIVWVALFWFMRDAMVRRQLSPEPKAKSP